MYTRMQAIKAYLENLADNDLFDLVVEESNNEEGNQLDEFDYYPMDEIDIDLENKSPIKILQMAQYGDFNVDEEFYKIDGNRNLESAYVFEVVDLIRTDLNSGEYSEILNYFDDSYRCKKGDYTLDSILQADSDDKFDDEFELIDTEDDEENE